VALTGGEPALYPELEAVVAGGKERGFIGFPKRRY
jgi:organic radical activating enzyme